ncbi:putative sugar transferase EpsL [Sedimentisphaera cyanobacteriorum]|uniref:Putative sugar transferase EpsL n=1 Tax=Sedimentisphaera cyanobacteriorum TaxID=1940790 RepID=A0A1Q2HNB1_9BACT|nr:sugar transferase [Sedimentisphaera cyanobacteriorum]AQQ08948.1 putative sugar transferase EpsL [Sedimentisphaera cyanobacteriorum]
MDIDPIVRQQLLDEVVTAPTKSELFKRKMKVYSWEWTLIFSLFLKRVIDIAGSLTAVLILSPVFIITALSIYLHDKGSVLFVQKRVGKNGRLFDMYKFRSMVVNADKIKEQILESNESSDGVIFKMKKDPRVTPIGRFIRKFSIDELPQLLNVLKGDMSLVGPRPPLPAEVAQYTLEQRKRLHVRPGITCVWQVSGRSDIPFTQQVQLDLDYIKSRSFFTDVKLLLKTIPAVLLGKGGY